MGSCSPFMAKYSAFNPYRIIRQEIGFPNPIGYGDAIAKSLYCGMKPIASWYYDQANSLPTGGVFNLEFSPEGSILVAACEKKSIQIFDPLTHQRVFSVNGAHSDCVNCVRFLDGRMFATCSDDTTIALWDVRNLKKKIRTLLGHSHWVKNIEFSVKDKLLVTSGLDGSIYTWDINSYTEYSLVYRRVFHASGLMRCRLSPDAKQMVMCTTGGLLVIVHDLNLSSLAEDLHGFKPNLYRLMQTSKQMIPIAALYDHLFDRKREENRVEFVSDFPDGNEAVVVSALQIHPQGWTALSRNISHDDRSEWSCIHDIQPDDPPSTKDTRDSATPRKPRRRPLPRPRRPYRITRAPVALATMPNVSLVQRLSDVRRALRSQPEFVPTVEQPILSNEPDLPTNNNTNASRITGGLSSMRNDVWEASITVRQDRMLREMASRGQVGRNFNTQRIIGINTGISPPRPRTNTTRDRQQPRLQEESLPATQGTSPSASGQTPSPSDANEFEETEVQQFINQNRDRLLYYIEEANEGKGFIKELCYSADGRLVCSPFGRGMRLLALNKDCSELPDCMQDFKGSKPLVDIGQSLGHHQDLVVCSKFSPRYHLLVTGCLEGRIVWYKPHSGESVF